MNEEEESLVLRIKLMYQHVDLRTILKRAEKE